MYFKPLNLNMVKNKRDLKSPRRKSLLSKPAARKVTTLASRTSANIKVIVRVRPPSAKEESKYGGVIVSIINDQVLVFDPEEETEGFFYHGIQQKGRDLLKKPKKNMQFNFDRVFGFQANNHDVFKGSTEDLINKLMDGCNCSVFVYGATGAGKTHTMLGHSENPGITMLTMKRLFERKSELMQERDFELAVTYLEVYNENVHDLLNPGNSLQLREDGKFGVIVAGITMKMIKNGEELFELLEQGNRNRTQHPTDANAESSRSHAVFQVYIRMTSKITRQVHVAKLSMIDLAGSERGAATGCTGQRFKEGSNINKSLLALGNCINSLADGKSHIPYRDSKLTRLLKDSLGGNCHTVMIANISPSSLTYEDTYNTLKYATRAMKIKSSVRKNVVAKDVNVEQYILIVENLNAEIERLKSQLAESESKTTIISTTTTSVETTTSCCRCNVSDAHKEQLMEVVNELKNLLDRIQQLEIAEQGVDLRMQMKEDANTRLSDFCDSADKKKGHKRLGDAVIRMEKQVDSLREEIYRTKEQRKLAYAKFDELLESVPDLKVLGDIERTKLETIEACYKAELQQKKFEKISSELNSHKNMAKKMSNLLKICYRQLKAESFLPESLKTAYKALMDDWQGIHNVTFEPQQQQQNVNVTVVVDDETRKRKVEETASTSSLDNTFEVTTTKSHPGLAVSAKQLLSKASSQPPRKIPKISPKKENKKPLSQKPTAAMGTSLRFATTKSSHLLGVRTPLSKK